ncbi:MAG: hypothetical protein DFNUSKGM_003315 [Candidatus Fervidibacter sacchari]|jgi:hypothetical protein
MRCLMVCLQVTLLLLIAWEVWGIMQCKGFVTYCEDCAGAVYNPGCGALCFVGERLDDEAYVCCCPTTTRNGYSACCEGRCVRWDCWPNPRCTYDVEFMGVVGMRTSCQHTDTDGDNEVKDMEGHCTSGGPGVRCP